MKIGDVAYDKDVFRGVTRYCKWYQYPFYRTWLNLIALKYGFYFYLNKIRVMKTPEGQVMRLSDIKFKK